MYATGGMYASDRECFAGWTVGPDGTAYDFQGRCTPSGFASGQSSSRICLNPYYSHGQTYYDSKGYCDPTKTLIPGAPAVQQALQGTPWMTYIVIGGVAYLAWKYRKKLF